jgi:hypothetical protein
LSGAVKKGLIVKKIHRNFAPNYWEGLKQHPHTYRLRYFGEAQKVSCKVNAVVDVKHKKIVSESGQEIQLHFTAQNMHNPPNTNPQVLASKKRHEEELRKSDVAKRKREDEEERRRRQTGQPAPGDRNSWKDVGLNMKMQRRKSHQASKRQSKKTQAYKGKTKTLHERKAEEDRKWRKIMKERRKAEATNNKRGQTKKMVKWFKCNSAGNTKRILEELLPGGLRRPRVMPSKKKMPTVGKQRAEENNGKNASVTASELAPQPAVAKKKQHSGRLPLAAALRNQGVSTMQDAAEVAIALDDAAGTASIESALEEGTASQWQMDENNDGRISKASTVPGQLRQQASLSRYAPRQAEPFAWPHDKFNKTSAMSEATAPAPAPAATDTEQKWKEAQAASKKRLKKSTFLGAFGKREQHDMEAFVMSKSLNSPKIFGPFEGHTSEQGVWDSKNYLEQVGFHSKPGIGATAKAPNASLPKLDGHVLVLGIGDVAIDCATSAFRCGAKQVTLAFHKGFNDVRAVEEVFQWARDDRCEFIPFAEPTKVSMGADGNLGSVEMVRYQLELDGTYTAQNEFAVKVDHVITAFGCETSAEDQASLAPLKVNQWGTVDCTPEGQTDIPWVWAGDDNTWRNARPIDELTTTPFAECKTVADLDQWVTVQAFETVEELGAAAEGVELTPPLPEDTWVDLRLLNRTALKNLDMKNRHEDGWFAREFLEDAEPPVGGCSFDFSAASMSSTSMGYYDTEQPVYRSVECQRRNGCRIAFSLAYNSLLGEVQVFKQNSLAVMLQSAYADIQHEGLNTLAQLSQNAENSKVILNDRMLIDAIIRQLSSTHIGCQTQAAKLIGNISSSMSSSNTEMQDQYLHWSAALSPLINMLQRHQRHQQSQHQRHQRHQQSQHQRHQQSQHQRHQRHQQSQRQWQRQRNKPSLQQPRRQQKRR